MRGDGDVRGTLGDMGEHGEKCGGPAEGIKHPGGMGEPEIRILWCCGVLIIYNACKRLGNKKGNNYFNQVL